MEYTNDIDADTQAFISQQHAETRNTVANLKRERSVYEGCAELRRMTGKKMDASLRQRIDENDTATREMSRLSSAYNDVLEVDPIDIDRARAAWLRDYILQIERAHSQHNINLGIAKRMKITEQVTAQQVAMIEIELAHEHAVAELEGIQARLPDEEDGIVIDDEGDQDLED